MIELYLSSDGKHTVHVSANTPAELATLTPTAKALYQKVIAEFGMKENKHQAAVKPAGNGPRSRSGFCCSHGIGRLC